MKKGSVLIIDDNSDMRDLIEHQVARISGHNVIMADSGERGLEMAREKRPDLILLDWMLPGMDGLEVLENLKESANTKDIIVYMLTSRGKMQDVESALEKGAADYVTKPIDMRELRRKVANAFDGKHASALPQEE